MPEPVPSVDDLVSALSRPGAYTDPTASVSVRETHMSWVFLTDSHACKLKKPLHYSYLDFRTPAARRLNCEREVRLNRRFTTDVYQGLGAVRRDDTGRFRVGPPAADALDWLVIMERLDDDRTLESALGAGRASGRQLRPVVELLHEGYRCLPSPRVVPFDYVNGLWRQAADDARQLQRQAFALDSSWIAGILRDLLSYIARHAGVLAARARGGWLVEGHGDLRPEHIYLDGTIRIVDCLEFNRAMRVLDPVDELATLALHCERLGAGWVRESLLDHYAGLTGDEPPPALVSCHMARRGLLWAKLAIWHLERSQAREAHWREKARAYLAIAAREASAAAAAE